MTNAWLARRPRDVEAAAPHVVPGNPPHGRVALGDGRRTIEKLREILGHSTVLVTERYAHLRSDLFGAGELSRIAHDLSPAGKVLPMARKSGPIGSSLAADEESEMVATVAND